MTFNQLKLTLLLLSFSTFATANGKGIVLDAGHGPKQPGATAANGYSEYTYNLSMVNSIEYFLSKNHIDVYKTQSNNSGKLSLTQRAQTPSSSALFVSIHHDSTPVKLNHMKNQIRGFSIFVSEKNPYYVESLRCANIVGQNLIALGEVPSTFHGMNIPGESKQLLSRFGVYKYNNLVVLKQNKKPALLIEIGVISNLSESERLSNQNVIWTISKNIADSLNRCLNT